MKFEWELIYDASYSGSYEVTTYRAKVLYGWIVMTQIMENNSTIFIPDIEHKWKITNE